MSQRPAFFIDRVLPELNERLQKTQNLIVQAPPGVGKSTRWIESLVRAGSFRKGHELIVLEPRRAAAWGASSFVAQLLGERLGESIGLHHRFERHSSGRTVVTYMTEGMFLRRCSSDPLLKGVGAVFIDEFHERHIGTELSFATLTRLQREREIQIVLISATAPRFHDTRRTSLWDVFEIDLPSYNNLISYLPAQEARGAGRPPQSFEAHVSELIIRANQQAAANRILVFLPGKWEMERVRRLVSQLGVSDRDLCFLHGDLPAEQQKAVFRKQGAKIILATNIAESSVTVEGVNFVIDSGLERYSDMDPELAGITTLRTRNISRAQSIQRAGRATREGNGTVWRAYDEQKWTRWREDPEPEIARIPLERVVTEAIDIGRGLILPDDFLDPISVQEWQKAIQVAQRENWIQESATRSFVLTGLGEWLLQSSLESDWGKYIYNIHPEKRASAIKLRSKLSRDQGVHSWVDHFSDDQEKPIHWTKDDDLLLRKLSLIHVDHVVVPETAWLRAFYRRVALWDESGIHLMSGVTLSPSRDLRAQPEYHRGWGMVMNISSGESKEVTCWLSVPRNIIESELQFAMEVVDFVDWEVPPGRLIEILETRIGKLCFSRAVSRLDRCPEATEAFSVLKKGLRVPTEDFIGISGLLAVGDLEVMQGTFTAFQQLKLGDLPHEFESNFVRQRLLMNPSLQLSRSMDWLRELRSELQNYCHRSLDSLLPREIENRRGKLLPVVYSVNQLPLVTGLIQDFFGFPQLLDRKYSGFHCAVELLGPHQRPVQRTSSLSDFFIHQYPALMKAFKRDYPRHYWPEDPVNAYPYITVRQFRESEERRSNS